MTRTPLTVLAVFAAMVAAMTFRQYGVYWHDISGLPDALLENSISIAEFMIMGFCVLLFSVPVLLAVAFIAVFAASIVAFCLLRSVESAAYSFKRFRCSMRKRKG